MNAIKELTMALEKAIELRLMATRRANHNLITLTAEFVTKTDKAYLLNFGTKEEPIWLPKSQCELDILDRHLSRGMTVEVTLDEEYAVEKGCC